MQGVLKLEKNNSVAKRLMNLSTRFNYQTLSHKGELRINLFACCPTGLVAVKGVVLYFKHFLTHLKFGVIIHT